MYIKSVSADNGKGNGDEDGNRDRDVDEYTPPNKPTSLHSFITNIDVLHSFICHTYASISSSVWHARLGAISGPR